MWSPSTKISSKGEKTLKLYNHSSKTGALVVLVKASSLMPQHIFSFPISSAGSVLVVVVFLGECNPIHLLNEWLQWVPKWSRWVPKWYQEVPKWFIAMRFTGSLYLWALGAWRGVLVNFEGGPIVYNRDIP